MVIHGTAGTSAADEDLGADVGRVAILNKSDEAWLYARADGDDAGVDLDDSYTIPPGARRTIPVTTDGNTVVSLIATAAGTDYEIEA